MGYDIIMGRTIRGGVADGPRVVLSNFWQVNKLVVGSQCVYQWRVQVQGDQEFPNFESVNVTVTVDSGFVRIHRIEPTHQTKQTGQVNLNAGVTGGLPGVVQASVGVNYSKPTEIKSAESHINGNEARWTFRGSFNKQNSISPEGVLVLEIDERMPHNDNMELRFAARAKISAKKGLRFKRANSSEPEIPELSIALISPADENQTSPFAATGKPSDGNGQHRDLVALIELKNAEINDLREALNLAGETENSEITQLLKSAILDKAAMLRDRGQEIQYREVPRSDKRPPQSPRPQVPSWK